MSWLPPKSVRLFGDLERRVDEVFAELIHGPWRVSSAALNWEPAIDVHETPEEYVILVDLPGVMPNEVRVHFEHQTLVVHGTRTSQQLSRTGTAIYTERFQGEFVRRIPIPGSVDSAHMQVSFVQGLLLVQIPKLTAKNKGGAVDTGSNA